MTKLSLSAHQRQMIDELGIDAWYLTPLDRDAMDADFHASQDKVAQIVAELAEVKTAAIPAYTPPNRTFLEMPKLSEKRAVAENPVEKKGVPEEETHPQRPRQVRTTREIAPIRLAPDLDLTPPRDVLHPFPHNNQRIDATPSAIKVALAALVDNTTGVETSQVLSGVGGGQSPQWFFVLPPPKPQQMKAQRLLDEDEEKLLRAVLSGVGKTWDDVYITPLVKQCIDKQQDPSEALLDKHLPVLAAEIALSNPARVFLLGRLPSQALLSTKAPLSALMPQDFTLQIEEKKYPLTALPSLAYFLALPVEKSRLWQRMKCFL